MVRIICLAALIALIPACDRFPWEEPQETGVVDEAVVERVIEEVLARLSAAYEETGPLFIDRLPGIKDDAAAREDFESWEAFHQRVRDTDPELQVEISLRITERMRELLESKPEEAPAEKDE